MLPNSAYSENTQVDKKIIFFDIAAGPLSESVVDFALQSEITLVVDQSLLSGLKNDVVVGRFSVKRALERLLASTPLVFVVDNENNVIVITKKQELVEQPVSIPENNNEPKIYEEVLVSGIRGSLLRGLELKYQSQDILEALSEEEIGKFPDTNLSEALQRLSGVTISYDNNEGNKVNVRGFDANFNLVTLNGRQMPSADLKEGVAAGSRAFNFADLAAENIAAVEVFKTSSADRPTGGIGSVINIKTSKPLSIDDATYSFGVKAVNDTSLASGDRSITPEFSGLASRHFLDDTLGLLVSGSYQARDSRSETVTMEWSKSLEFFNDPAELEGLFDPNEDYWYPSNQNVSVAHHQRERINAQLVFQFQPNDKFLLSSDFTFSMLDQYIERTDFSIETNRILDVNQPFEMRGATVVRATEVGGFYQFSRAISDTRHRNDSLGFNLQYDVSDRLLIEFDAHHSVSKLIPQGRGNDVNIRKDAQNIVGQTLDATLEIPSIIYTFYDSIDANGQYVGVRDYVTIEDFIYTNEANAIWATLTSTIDQAKVDVEWNDDDMFLFKGTHAGVMFSSHSTRSKRGDTLFIDPFSGFSSSPVEPDPALYQQRDGSSLFNEFSGNFSGGAAYYDFDIGALADEIARRVEGLDPEDWLPPRETLSMDWANFQGPKNYLVSDSEINEDSSSAYLELLFGFDFKAVSVDVVLGQRYEKTDFHAISRNFVPIDIAWRGAFAYEFVFSDSPIPYENTFDYDVMLPSISFRSEWWESLVVRLHSSKSISRFDMDLITTERLIYSLASPEQGRAYEGSSTIIPYESENLDAALEWYYGEGNSISLSWFSKSVDGFPASIREEKNLFGIRNVFEGDRANAIRDELIANGMEPSPENVFNLMIERHPPEDSRLGIRSNETDPLYSWTVFSVENAEDATIDGYEVAVQQLIGSTGFGVFANYTHVDSSVDFNFGAASVESSIPASGEFLNFVGFYENDQWQFRVAYHWNDEYPTVKNSFSGVVPIYTEAYGQVDALLSYRWNDHYVISLEGINITNETQRLYNTERERLYSAQQFGPRYQLGFRANF